MLRKKGVLYCFDIFLLFLCLSLGAMMTGKRWMAQIGKVVRGLEEKPCKNLDVHLRKFAWLTVFFTLNTMATFHVHQSWIRSKPRESITGNYVIHENQNNIRWPWIPWQILMGNVVARKVRSAHSLCCAPLSRSSLLTGLLNHFAYCLVGRPNKKWERQKK